MVEQLLPADGSMPDFGKVAVVMGGWSAERDVSLMSGQQVFDALVGAGVDAHAVDAGRDIAEVLISGGFARAFLVLHGRGGEDGTVQAALELAGIPCTGSGVLGSALAMDKLRAKDLCRHHGLPTPSSARVASAEEAVAAGRRIGLPLVVKPTREGSSIGVTIVREESLIRPAFDEAARFGEVMLESFMSGEEITAGIVGSRVLPLVAIRPQSGFYDYAAKYLLDTTEYDCPARLPPPVAARIGELALHAFEVLGCRGWGRVDFMLDANGEPQFMECNTVPGMTDHSLLPRAAAAAGIGFTALCLEILEGTLAPAEVHL